MAPVRRRVIVHGRVQGVFFRDSARREAGQRGLTGWVRNRDDDSVEIVIQGEAAGVDAFVSWARLGPSQAQVSTVDVDEVATVEGEAQFEVR